jgi:hypothetical protein
LPRLIFHPKTHRRQLDFIGLLGGDMTSELDKGIKLIAATSESFAKLEEFRSIVPQACKEQIESIGNGFAGFEIRYKQLWDKAAYLPSNPLQINYDGEWMRVYYESLHVMVPTEGKPVNVQFVGGISST